MTERADYSCRLQAQLAAIQVDPQVNRCNDCVNAWQNSHHALKIVPFRNTVTVVRAVTVRPSAYSRLFPRAG